MKGLHEDGREMAARFKEQGDKAFIDWLQQPLVKISLSQMPEGDNRDMLRELLRSAFDTGCGCGSAMMAMEMITRAMKDNKLQ